jgi:hypothetical protein
LFFELDDVFHILDDEKINQKFVDHFKYKVNEQKEIKEKNKINNAERI